MATPKKKPEDKKKVGCKPDFKPEYCRLAFNYALLGCTDVELASFFEVDESTIYRWKKAYPEFCKALKAGKDDADAKVVKSLYKRALGYKHKEDDIRVCDGQIVITPTVKQYPPDPTSAIFFLKNRQPKKWRDKTEVDQSVTIVDVSATQFKLTRRKK